MAARADNTVARTTTARGQVKVQAGDPEYTLSVIGLVTALCGQPIIGLIVSAIALKQSKREDRYNLFALLGFIFGIVFSAMFALLFVFYVIIFVASFAHGFGSRY